RVGVTEDAPGVVLAPRRLVVPAHGPDLAVGAEDVAPGGDDRIGRDGHLHAQAAAEVAFGVGGLVGRIGLDRLDHVQRVESGVGPVVDVGGATAELDVAVVILHSGLEHDLVADRRRPAGAELL